MSFYNQLKQFLDEADSGNLKTKHYINEYQRTKVRVSFGMTVPAHIPWISFLRDPNTTSNGIYPVYLYFKQEEILILAYGVSETKDPNYIWPMNNLQTIKNYFEENGLEKPKRYGNSFVYNVYDRNNLPNRNSLDKDLDDLINFYKTMDFQSESIDGTKVEVFSITSFIQCLPTSNLIYSNLLVKRFIASLLTKPFVILTGLAGSGKTKLAQAFVHWICQDESQYRIVPVGADWTNREPLLGYPNALNTEEYIRPDTGVLDLILSAQKHPQLPYFLILDEMNLSHVERYFADFLSVMESNDGILLYSGNDIDGVPSKLSLPKNLFIIGTVNIDETTNMFSPKVLDRANTIEFRVSEEEMKSFFEKTGQINMEALKTKGAMMASSFLEMAGTKEISLDEEIKSELLKFFAELKKVGAEFGYRTATEILQLIHHLSQLDTALEKPTLMDVAIMQKLLPKLHGSQRKLRGSLERLGGFCLEDSTSVRELFDKKSITVAQDPNIRYPLSFEKIHRMYYSCLENGFASFAEA
ncbi:DUF3578 domain-containing protein [Echinicola strongylocentroti]|uniref:DUF3578 domain-containing protein n=1 Tax=Echinicola strongylocentroti TaxID=1795355 RepID=A0A2Z4IIJ6_9BACT|nr:DUF3578 domain-containing protein [Echinicola strongylocentroti]AWW30725.1 DUF3578 domain-containing protein [Echinicola strongylocentroti]